MTSDTQSPPRSPQRRPERSDSRESRRSASSSGRRDRDDDSYRRSRRRSPDRYSSSHHSSSRRDRDRDRGSDRGRDERDRERGRDRDRDDRRDRDRERDRDRDYRRSDDYRRSERRSRGGSGRSSRRYSRSPSPEVDDTDRDRRTVFVQQLSARLRTKELIRFFEKAGAVRDASIVKDKISGRSKGVAYVEFKEQEAVAKAIDMTGERLLGIPVIVQHTEAEKNRLAMETAAATAAANGITLPQGGRGSGGGTLVQSASVEARIYAGNIHFGVTDNELQQIFESFGEIEFVNLQRDQNGKSKGYAFIQ